MKSVYAFGLSAYPSVCLSACACSNSRKYSSKVLKFMYVIHIWHGINRIESSIHTTNGSSTETHKGFLIYCGLLKGNFTSVHVCIALNVMKLMCVIKIDKNMFTVKNILNSINISISGSHKNFPIHYGLWEGGFFKAHFSIFI